MRRVSSHISSPEMRTVARSLVRLLRRIAAGGLPDLPGVVVVHDAARGHGQIEDAGAQIVGRPAPGCACSGPAGGAASARCARRCWPRTPSRPRGRPPVARAAGRSGWRRSSVRGTSRSAIAGRILDGDLGQRFRMRVEQLDALAARCAPSAAPAAPPWRPAPGRADSAKPPPARAPAGSAPCSFQAMPAACRAISSERGCG